MLANIADLFMLANIECPPAANTNLLKGELLEQLCHDYGSLLLKDIKLFWNSLNLRRKGQFKSSSLCPISLRI
jgi:hypothetical protein